jgi:hypothetical protein
VAVVTSVCTPAPGTPAHGRSAALAAAPALASVSLPPGRPRAPGPGRRGKRPGPLGWRHCQPGPHWPTLSRAGSGPMLSCIGPIPGSKHRRLPGRVPRPHSASRRPVCSLPPRPAGADPVGSLTCALSTASFRADSATLPSSPHPDPNLPLRCARRARGTIAGAAASRPSSQPS